MVHLFFNKNLTEAQEEQKLKTLLSLLEVYNLITHDNQGRRSEGLQAIVDHLETMVLTPSLKQWVEDDLIQHLDYHGVTSDLKEKGSGNNGFK